MTHFQYPFILLIALWAMMVKRKSEIIIIEYLWPYVKVTAEQKKEFLPDDGVN